MNETVEPFRAQIVCGKVESMAVVSDRPFTPICKGAVENVAEREAGPVGIIDPSDTE